MNEILKLLSDIPILIVLIVFIISIIYTLTQYIKVGKNLNIIIQFISNFKKSDLNFRFKELDTWMMSNPYVSLIWTEFKNTKIFLLQYKIFKQLQTRYIFSMKKLLLHQNSTIK